MSSFGSGSTTTAGASITLRNYTGTDGNQAGTDGLVPGPGIAQAGYVLGAGGDWTLTVSAINDLNDATNRIATTAFVQNRVAQIVAGGGGIALGGIQDVDLAGLVDNQLLQYNANDAEWQPLTLTIASISDVDLAGLQDGNALVYDAAANNGNGGWVPGEGGGGGAGTLNELGDVTINGGADKHFLVRNAQGQYVNRLISTADLSDEADLVLETRGATFGAFDYDFTGANSITVPAPNNGADATTKTYVDTQVATKQPIDATLTALAGVVTVADKLIYATGADAFTTTDFTNFGRILIANANAGDARTDLGLGTSAVEDVGVFAQVANNLNDLADVGTARTNLGLGTSAVEPVGTFAQVANNLNDLANAGTARTNLGLGTASTQNVGAFAQVANNLADLDNVGTARTNLGLGTSAVEPVGTFAQVANNLNDLADVGTARTNLGLGTASTQNVGTFAQVANNLADLADAGTARTNLGLGTAAQSAVGDFLASNADIDDLGGISTAGKAEGKILKFNAGLNLIVADDEGKTQAEIEDIVGGMVDGNTETGITVTYQGADNTLDFVVDNTVVGFLAGVQTFNGDKTFTGAVDLTGATATGVTQNASDNSTSLATTAYVDAQIDTDITALDLPNNYQGLNTNLTSISGLNIVDGSMMIGNGNNSFEILTIQLGVENFLKSTGRVAALSDVTVNNDALNNANHILVSTGLGGFESQTISTTNLSNSGDIVLETADATFGANTYDFTGATAITVPAPQNASDATTKTYVDTQVATKQTSDATLTALAGLATGVKKLIYSTANDTLEMTDLSDNAKTFIASDAGVADLDNVNIGGLGNALADGQTLRYDGANTEWKNSKLAFGDLDQNAGSTQNVALLNQEQTFSNNITFTAEVDLTGATATAETVANNNVEGNSTRIATTAFVKNVVNQVGGVSDLADLTDVTLGADNGNGVAEAVGQVLRVSAVANNVATFRNAPLSFDDLSDTGNVVETDANATFGAFSYDFTGATITVPAPQNGAEATTKTYVDTEVGGKQDSNARLDDIAGLGVDNNHFIVADGANFTLESPTDAITSLGMGVGNNDLLIGTGANTFGTIATTANGRSFLASEAGVNDLSDVLIAGVANAQILVYEGANDNQWKNVSLSGDITISNAGVATIGALAVEEGMIANNAITTDKIENSAVTNAKLENSYVSITDGANTDTLPLGQTLTFNAVANETTVAVSADQGGGADGVEITIGLPDDVTIAQDLTVTRNLIVNGTTTTLNTATLDVEDTIIRLNKGVANEANPNDIGLFFERGTTGDDAIFFWDEGDDFFKLGLTTNDDHEATDFGGTTTPGGLQIGSLELRDNLATSLVVKEGANAYLTFDTSDADEKVVFGKVFEAVSASKIGNIEISDGQIQTTNGNNNLSFNDNNLTTTGTANFGATTVDSLDASNGGITQAGAISGITSLAGASMDLLLTDNDADALDIREAGLGSYLTFDTTDAQGQVVVNEGGADIDFRVEGDNSDHLIFTQASTDRVGINTNNPTALFHVNGNSILVGDLTQSGGAVVFNNGLGDNDFRVAGDNQANLLFVDASADSIGIGKNNPSKTLDISGTVAISSTLEVTGKTTLAGSLDLTTGSATGITFRSEIADGGADADQILLRVNQGGGGPAYKSIKWVAADDRFSVESSLKSEGNFTVGDNQFIANATNGNLTVGGTATINNADGTADLIVQNNGVDVLNVDASAGTTTVTGQLKTDDLRAKTAGTDNFKVVLEDGIANALEIYDDSIANESYLLFNTQGEKMDFGKEVNFNSRANFITSLSLQSGVNSGVKYNSNLENAVSQDATLMTIEGGTNKSDVVLRWDTSEDEINLNSEAILHIQGKNLDSALTIGGATGQAANIVMTTAGAITLGGTLDSPTINTDKITNKNATSLVVELADAEASALVIRQGANESYLTIDTDAQTLTFNEDANFDASATFDTTVEITGITTLNDSLKVNKAGSDTGIIFNADREAGENINAQDFDALLLHVENGGSNATDAYFKWDDSESSFKIEGGKLFSATEISIGSEANNALTKNLTIGTDGAVGTSGAITTSSVVNFSTASQGAIVFNSDLGGGANPADDDDFGLTVNRGAEADAKLYWDESATTWQFETGNVQVQNSLVVDSDANGAITVSDGSIVSASGSISFGDDNLTTTGSITSASPADATDDTTVATTEWVRDRSIGDFSDVNLADFDANDQILVWDQVNQEFKKGTSVYNAEQARDDVGAALAGGTHTFTGDDGTIAFTSDDANDVINLALGITTENLKDVSADQATNNQVLRFTTAEGANQNKYVPTTLGTAADVDTGLDGGEIPTLTTHYLSNQSETADLILTGRVIETIDYGAVSEAFDGATDFAIDMNGGVDDFSETVIYGSEDYGMLVV